MFGHRNLCIKIFLLTIIHLIALFSLRHNALNTLEIKSIHGEIFTVVIRFHFLSCNTILNARQWDNVLATTMRWGNNLSSHTMYIHLHQTQEMIRIYRISKTHYDTYFHCVLKMILMEPHILKWEQNMNFAEWTIPETGRSETYDSECVTWEMDFYRIHLHFSPITFRKAMEYIQHKNIVHLHMYFWF